MRSLADTYDVIVPEHPGFGTSDTPDWLDNIHDLAYFFSMLSTSSIFVRPSRRCVARWLDRG